MKTRSISHQGAQNFHSNERANPSVQTFSFCVNEKKNPIYYLSHPPRNRCTRLDPGKLFLSSRLVRPISLEGRAPSSFPPPPRTGISCQAMRRHDRVSLANVGGRARRRIKAGTGSGAIIQSSGQLGSIVLIAFTVAAVDRKAYSRLD